jgi:hypothetical protein
VAAELAAGGIWDITRLPSVRDLVMDLGYPSYLLVLLGTWAVLGAAALLIPRRWPPRPGIVTRHGVASRGPPLGRAAVAA